MLEHARTILSKIAALFRRTRLEQDFEEEVQSHIVRLEERFKQQGRSPEEARFAARREFGGIEQLKELNREHQSFVWIDHASQDLRFAFRSLRKNPGFTIVVVLTLALGIGTNTAIFSIVNAVLLRPLPYKDPDRLVRIVQNTIEIPPTIVRTPVMDHEYFLALRERAQTLSQVAAYTWHPNAGSLAIERLTMTLSRRDGPITLAGAKISPALFPMLGVEPFLGRNFEAAEEIAGANTVVILSHQAWNEYFGGNGDVLGETLILDNRSYKVVGVLPENFDFPDRQTEFWIPLAPANMLHAEADYEDGRSRNHYVIARLKNGTSIEAAAAEVETIFRQLDRMYYPPSPMINLSSIDRRSEIVVIRDEMVAPVRPALRILFFAVGFVLLIVCANVANLLLARTATRQREMAIRIAMGGGRGRLIRQVLTESMMLALAGAVAGTALALVTIQVARSHGGGNIPRLDEIGIDLAVLLFTLSISMLSGLVFGLTPAFRVAQTDHLELIHQTAASGGFNLFGRYGSRAVLVITQIALAIVLLIGAGLLIRAFEKLINVRPGYDPTNVLTFQLTVSKDRYADPGPFYDELVSRLEAVPAVQSASTASVRDFPMTNFGPFNAKLYGLPTPMDVQEFANIRRVSREYFDVLGIRILRGRSFHENDGPGGGQVVILSNAFAKRYFSSESPIGRTIDIGSTPVEVVGVVDDIRYSGPQDPPQLEVYVDLRQFPTNGNIFGGQPQRAYLYRRYIAARTNGNPASIIPIVRSIVHQMDSQMRLDDVAIMEERLSKSSSIARPRFYTVILALFAVMALALAAIGIYGVMAYSVTQRTQEIGIRMALGAGHREVLSLVLRQGVVITIVGLGVGLSGALAVTGYLESMLFALTPLDPITYLVVSVVFALTATFACYLPARRAMKVDPLVALRHE